MVVFRRVGKVNIQGENIGPISFVLFAHGEDDDGMKN